MVRIIITLLALSVVNVSYALTQVTATIDKNPVTVKESIILTVTADDDVDAAALDTSALAKDFIVGRTSVSTQTSMINFKTSRSTKWQTVLIARRSGTLMIPSLVVDGHTTAPITLTVLEASHPNATAQQDVFITASLSNKEVFVQQMLTLSVKLHFAAELKRGSLTEPRLDGATIKQIGKDGEGETIVNGRRYRIIERNYAVTPQQSGEFTLTSPMFSGEIMVQSARRSNFLSFGETKAISVIGEELPIHVKPVPERFQGHWLPSELITLHQEWQPQVQKSEFIVGEPITRTITLTAVGLSEEQLPALELSLPQGLKLYPDQATKHSTLTNGRFVSQIAQNYAIVASKPGSYQLPEVSIPWWNTVTNRLEYANLPAQEITVKPNSEFTDQNDASNSANIESQTPEQSPKTILVEQSSPLQWLFLALWLVTVLAWISTEVLRRRNKSTPSGSTMPVSNVQLAIIAACKKGQGQTVLGLLIPWFNSLEQNTKPIKTIEQIKIVSKETQLALEIDQLQRYLYGSECNKQDGQQWQGANLLQAIIDTKKQFTDKQSKSSFNLNP